MVAPKLRFQEFDGDWESKKLKDLTDILKCGVASTPKYVTEGGYPFLSAQNISRNGEMNYSKVNNISDDFYKKISKTKLLKGDILYSRVGASYGVAAIFDREEEYGVYVSLTQIRVNDTLNNIFLKQFLNSPKARIQAEQGVFQGGGVQNLNVGVVEEFNLTLPSKQEQTKIASFLAAVDEKITQLTQKHQLLSQYKQGMMQKLFSQQIRFKADDGSEFEGWEITTLGLTGKFIGGGTPSKEVTEFWQGSIPWISSSDLVDESIFNINITRYISTEALNQSATKLIPANSILIVSRVGVGKVAVTNRDICTSQDFTSLVLNNGNPVFFGYLIKSLTGRLLEMNQGTSIKGFVKDDLSNLKVEIPNLAEQTKIANFLSAIDQKIDVVSKQLDQAKLWKKGLLQQMFV